MTKSVPTFSGGWDAFCGGLYNLFIQNFVETPNLCKLQKNHLKKLGGERMIMTQEVGNVSMIRFQPLPNLK